MQSSNPKLDPIPDKPPQHFTLRGMFTPYEMSTISTHLEKAVARSEHNHLTKKKLHGLQLKSSTQGLHGRQKYSKQLGVLGWEQLTLRPLAPVKSGKEHQQISETISEARRKKLGSMDHSSIRDAMKSIVAEIGAVDWLSEPERAALTETFITDVASRYNDVERFLDPHLSPQNNRRLILNIFDQLRVIKDQALERVRFKRKKMEKANIFDEEMNSGRMVSLFRVELNQRINLQSIMKAALLKVEAFRTISQAGGAESSIEAIISDAQDLQWSLNRVIKTPPKLLPPSETLQLQYQSRHRLKPHLTSDMKQASFKFVRKVSLLYKKPGDRSGSGNKIFLSETTEDLEKIMKRNAKMKRRRFQEDSDSDEEIPAPSWLEDRNDGDIKINNEAFENPILKAHAEIIKKTGDVSAFRDFSHVRNYERYLPQSQFFTHTDILTKSPSVQPEPEECQLECLKGQKYTETTLPDKTVVWLMKNRMSDRKQKFLLALDAPVESFSSDIQGEEKTESTDTLDEKFKRFKEVEELYDEIMKTIIKEGVSGSEVEESSVYGCPSAPNDPHLPIADAFLGYKDNYQRLLLLEKAVPNPKRNPDEDLKRIMTPSVHKNIRGQSDGVNVFPDDFVNNRKRAMKAVVSSRYNHFRYNYGGYVPFDIDEKRKLDATSFGLNDYKKHLNVRRCDFIAELLLGEDKKDSVMAETKKRLEEENARNRMLEAQREEEARLEKIQYKKGEWNTHVLNYMSEVCGNKSEGDSNELGKAKECEGSILVGIDDEPFLPNIANDGCPTLETTESGGACPKIETPESGEADTKIHEIEPPKILDGNAQVPEVKEQERPPPAQLEKSAQQVIAENSQRTLEEIWGKLYMPLDQKLDMAVKYGHHRFRKIEIAVELWTEASDLILARERILDEIETFEMVTLFPERFFRKESRESANTQIKEVEKREKILRRLHSAEGHIQDVASQIRHQLRETVTFKGIPILEKMKHDYGDIVRRITQKRSIRSPSAQSKAQSHSGSRRTPSPKRK